MWQIKLPVANLALSDSGVDVNELIQFDSNFASFNAPHV